MQQSRAGLLASLALRVNLRLFKALCALVPLREDDDSLLKIDRLTQDDYLLNMVRIKPIKRI
jgi:hypothetical protein